VDKNGNFVSKWGSSSNFERATGIAYDVIPGLLYVSHKDRNNIQVFSAPSSFDPTKSSLYSNELKILLGRNETLTLCSKIKY